MDHIVGLYEADARERAKRLLWTGWLVTGLIALALASIGRFILFPATRVIAQNLRELRAARDLLEDRVLERTKDLEHANHALAAEHAERIAAEGRHRALVEQLGHAARVNSMGEMASGLAHELNQPLGAVVNYVGGCLERVNARNPDLAELHGALERAHDAAVRAGEIVRRIRSFVSRHEFERVQLDPADVVREAVELARPDAERRDIALETEMAPDLPRVLGDAIQLQQVLLNLIHNAFDAIEAKRPVNPRVLVQVERSSDGAVKFAVFDNGEGLGPEVTRRLFEPFFSTRADGMGMGLAISRGIIEAHHGHIAAGSTTAGSTVIHFSIPVADPSSPESDTT
jgi:C4-dicarboxylate-specific signal transduction histidine kinase